MASTSRYVNDKAFNAKVDDAQAETDRTKQAQLWQALNKEAMQKVWVDPDPVRHARSASPARRSTRPRATTAAVYLWAPYGSWPYADLYVTQ